MQPFTNDFKRRLDQEGRLTFKLAIRFAAGRRRYVTHEDILRSSVWVNPGALTALLGIRGVYLPPTTLQSLTKQIECKGIVQLKHIAMSPRLKQSLQSLIYSKQIWGLQSILRTILDHPSPVLGRFMSRHSPTYW